jgi:hypothetical protein
LAGQIAQQAFDLGAQVAKLIGEVAQTARPPLQGIVSETGAPTPLQSQQATPDTSQQGRPPLKGSAYTPGPFDWLIGTPALAEQTAKTDDGKPLTAKVDETPKKPLTSKVEETPKQEEPKFNPENASWDRYSPTKKLTLYGPLFKSEAAIEDCGAWQELMQGDNPAISLDDYYTIVAATKVEGSPDSLQGYDDKVLTLGSSQKVWSVDGGGELADQIFRFKQDEARLSQQDPNHVNKYIQLFANHGFIATDQKVDANGQLVFKKDPKTQKPLLKKNGKPRKNARGQVMMDPSTGTDLLDKNGNKVPETGQKKLYYQDPKTGALKTGKWFKQHIADMQAAKAKSWGPILQPLQTAGADPSFQRFQIKDLKARLDANLAKTSNGYPLSDWAQGRELRAQLLQLSINRPNNVLGLTDRTDTYADFGHGDGVPDTLSNGALEDFIKNHPKAADPTQWTNLERFGDGKKNKGYEKELSDLLLEKELRSNHVTDAQNRADKVRNYLKSKLPLPKWMRPKKK